MDVTKTTTALLAVVKMAATPPKRESGITVMILVSVNVQHQKGRLGAKRELRVDADTLSRKP